MTRNIKPARSSSRARKEPVEWVSASEFKATCLELMDRVWKAGAEYVVTKDGAPVARLVPYAKPSRTSLKSTTGTVLRYERPSDPADNEEDESRC